MAGAGPRRGRKRREPGSVLESQLNSSSIVDQENINIMELTNNSTIIDEEDPNQVQMELRRKYTELIDNCQAYKDEEGIDPDLKEKVSTNIDEANELFKKIGGGGPGDMYMAFVHMKTCSGMLLSKTEQIGYSVSGFTLEGFLSALIRKGTREGEYSASFLSRWTNRQGYKAQKSVGGLKAILGTFDRSQIAIPPVVKEKKQRAPRRKPFEDSDGIPKSQHEEVELTEAQRAKNDKDSPEAQSKEILKILSTNHQASTKPVNLNEFVMEEDLSSYFQNMFYVSFLVRDGFVSVERKKRKDKKLIDSDLLIAPENPPEPTNNDDPAVSGTRSQHIVSFNAATFKALAQASQGEFMIKRPSSSGSRSAEATTSKRKR